MDPASAVAAASAYREANPQHRAGVVLVWRGRVYGWKNTLRNPEHERPGAFGVDEAGTVWRAAGGNDDDGAAAWLQT